MKLLEVFEYLDTLDSNIILGYMHKLVKTSSYLFKNFGKIITYAISFLIH